MEFLGFKPVSPSFVEFVCPTEMRTDVYSYNFPDDRRLLKLLGRHR
jgi:hypothetical protein